MDYSNIYKQIVNRAKAQNRVKGCGVYYEAHHIIPRCLGGGGKVHQWKTHENIVLLTPKEHRIAHACLFLCNPNNSSLALAYVKMYYGNRYQSRDGKVNSKLYTEARIKASEIARSVRIGKKYEDIMGKETAQRRRKAQSEALKGRKHTEESLARMRKPKPTGFGDKISKALKGRLFKEVTLQKLRLKERPILQMDRDLNPLKVWRSAMFMSSVLGISQSNINRAIKKGKLCGGFRWDYF